MSASKIVRNHGSHRTVTYGGTAYEFPGDGDTTMVPGEVADFVEQHCFREGLQIVHPVAEAAERERQAVIEAPVEAPAPVVEPEPAEDASKAESEPQPAPVVTEAPPDPPVVAKPARNARNPRKHAAKRKR